MLGFRRLRKVFRSLCLATGALPNMDGFKGIDLSKLNVTEIAVLWKGRGLFAAVSTGGLSILLTAAAVATIVDVIKFLKDLFGTETKQGSRVLSGTDVPQFGAMLASISIRLFPNFSRVWMPIQVRFLRGIAARLGINWQLF